MAPYLGLLDRGRELTAGCGYTRKDLSDISFRISPSGSGSMIVLNYDKVCWSGWETETVWATLKVTDLALYADITGDEMLTSCPLSAELVPYDALEIPPGSLRFNHRFTNDDDGVTNVGTVIEKQEVEINHLARALKDIVFAPKGTTAQTMRAVARAALGLPVMPEFKP